MVTTSADHAPDQVLWGARAIGGFLGLSTRQVFHLTDRGFIPHFKVGRTLCASRKQLVEWLRAKVIEIETNRPDGLIRTGVVKI